MKASEMTEKERLCMRAKMLSWNKGHKCMEAALEEFAEDEQMRELAAAVLGGCCAYLLERGYDHLTIESLLIAQVAAAHLWKELHRPKERKQPKKKKQQ